MRLIEKLDYVLKIGHAFGCRGVQSFVNFCVSYSLTPHLSGQIDMISDMTHSFIWQRFIGKEITLTYREPEQALLEISDGIDSVWCWAEGSFGSDVLHISTELQVAIK